MKYYFGRNYTQDGNLDSSCGRIVIYQDKILVSRMQTADHNYLLRGLASRYGLNKDAVISNAIRLYFRQDGDRVIISQVRKIDEDMFFNNQNFNAGLIKSALK